MGLTFPCLGLSATIVAQQRRQFGFKSLAMRSLAGRVLGGVVGVTAAVLGAGVWSLVFQQIVTALVSSLVLWLTCERAPRFRFGRAEFRELIGFSAFTVSSVFLFFTTKRLFTILAGVLLGVAVAGYLNISFRIVDVLWGVLATAVGQVALPMLAGLQTDPARVERAYKKAVEFATLALYPFFVGIAVTAPEIIDTSCGQRWAPAVPSGIALACLIVVQAPRLFVTPVLTAGGRPRDAVVGLVAELAFMIAMVAVFGLPTLGWAVGVWIASELLQIPISAWMLRRATGYGIIDQFAGVRTPFLAAAAMALAVTALRAVLPPGLLPATRLASFVPLGAVVYAGSVLLLDRPLAQTFAGFVGSAFSRVKA